METPKRFANQPVATWPRLRGLLDATDPGGEVINMTIGTPMHAIPDFVAPMLAEEVEGFRGYPDNNGTPALLTSIQNWIKRRYGAEVEHNQIMALNGTREGLYNAAMALCPEVKNGQRPIVLIPNPFYPAYGVAALSVNAKPVFMNTGPENGNLPDFTALPSETLDRVTIAYICSPANPQGAVADKAYWKTLFDLAEKHDFYIFSDECYSEIYRDAPPPGALEMAKEFGADPERVVVFHSLSKRSNLAGLRSGFCAAGPKSMARIRALRAAGGTPVPGPIQAVSAKVWDDETHVEANRTLYSEKFDLADEIMAGVDGFASPEAGFFLWMPVENGEEAAMKLWQETGVRTLPGAYIARETDAGNPGDNFIRVALVAPKEDVQRGLSQLRACIYE